MSSTPKAPCSPPLNLVPNGTAGSAFPPPLDSSDIPNTDSNPGFGDLVSQILGDAGDVTDGFDLAVDATSAAIDVWDSALSAQDGALDTILATLGTMDATPATNAFTDYGNTFSAGDAIVTGLGALAAPAPFTLPDVWLPSNVILAVTPAAYNPQQPGKTTLGDPGFIYNFAITVVPASAGGITGVHLRATDAVIRDAILVLAEKPYYDYPAGGIALSLFQKIHVDVSINPGELGYHQQLLMIDGSALVAGAIEEFRPIGCLVEPLSTQAGA